MQQQSRDPKNPAPGSKKPSDPKEKSREPEKKETNTDSQVESAQQEVVVNEQEQNNITNKSGENMDSGTGMSASGREKSFYRNDLPESEASPDVDERTRQIQP